MKPIDRLIDQQLEAIVEQGRQVPRAPDVVRARLIARARVAFAASVASAVPLPPHSTGTAWRGRRVAVAAGLLLVLATAAAGAALHARATRAVEGVPETPPPPEPRAVRGAPPPNVPAEVSPELPSSPRPQRPHRAVTTQESYAAELQLLQRAQSAYARHDFAGALALLAEHGHRFPNGRLAEEREALRVRSLARAGRSDQARRALAAFAGRFPHSAFLPRLREAAPPAGE